MPTILDAVQKLEFLKAAAKSNNIPQLPETLKEIIDDLLKTLDSSVTIKEEIKIPVKFLFFKKVVVVELHITYWFNSTPPRFKVYKVKVV